MVRYMELESNQSKILGVDRSIIEEFLILIRDKYPLVDYANYFLETHTGASGVNIALANQRDFITDRTDSGADSNVPSLSISSVSFTFSLDGLLPDRSRALAITSS